MSRGQDFSRFNATTQTFLEADIGPVEADAECAVGPCDDDAVYRVPWPQFGGDVTYCPCHLARYRSDYPKEWNRLQEGVNDDPPTYATRANRFRSPTSRQKFAAVGTDASA